MSGRILGSNTLIQGAIPTILRNTPESFYDGLVETLYHHAKIAYKMLKVVKGLSPIMPNGAMYMMIGIDIDHFPNFTSDLHFVQEMVKEQSVFCLPGQVYHKFHY